MELKVWVEGIQRIVCGVTEKTTCQDVVYALAHATGKTGRFTLIERWRNNERLLAPQEHPLKVLAKWGEYSNDVQFILQRSPLDSSKSPGPRSPSPKEVKPGFNGPQMKKSTTFSGPLPSSNGPNNQAAIWKSPPGVISHKPVVSSMSSGRLSELTHPHHVQHEPHPTHQLARLSPDSGRGSDPTGSDTSNFSDQEKAKLAPPRSSQISGYTPPGWQVRSARFTSPSPDRGPGADAMYGYSRHQQPPAYRPPPQPGSGQFRTSSSPASDPPPYREPPPPPPGKGHAPPVASPVPGRHISGLPAHPVVRAPHYSPPPHHRDIRGHKGPSPGRNTSQGVRGVSASPSRGQASPSRVTSNWTQQQWPQGRFSHQTGGKSDYSDLMSLVQAQQTRLQSQQAEIKHCDNELKYWDGATGASGPGRPSVAPGVSDVLPAQLEAVISEVRRLEETATKNEEELTVIMEDRQPPPTGGIRGELDQLKHRLEMTDIELQKTNTTLRRLSEEMRCYSLEKTKEREEELRGEVDRIHAEIKILQKTNEDSATISDKLSREVADVEHAILARKGEVEKLIADMKSANLESLTISPPEETKAFLDDISGPSKPGTTRKMLGSPRQLENAVPTSKNPHGVWV